jgi:hypothetical protein
VNREREGREQEARERGNRGTEGTRERKGGEYGVASRELKSRGARQRRAGGVRSNSGLVLDLCSAIVSANIMGPLCAKPRK